MANEPNAIPDRDAKCRLTILGATGSVGQSSLDVVRHQRERFDVQALVANNNVQQLAKDAREFGAAIAVTANPALYEDLKTALAGTGIEAAAGDDAVVEAGARPADLVMAAIVGARGLRPTLAAIRAGANIGLANKECLVSAGTLFMDLAGRAGVDVLPVDSEHSAIFQCLEQDNARAIDKITLTASGGPFRQMALKDIAKATPQQALNHPNWSMGAKISIDSATMMNKGLELIEAFHLFPVTLDDIDIVVHPQSIVHSFVSYIDGSVLAQMGVPDMRTPIAFALAWPERMAAPVERLNLAQVGTLTFEQVDDERFPAIGLCRSAVRRGGNATTILNAANEIAVAEFLSQKIGFMQITSLNEACLSRAERDGMIAALNSVDDVWAADEYGRTIAGELARRLQ